MKNMDIDSAKSAFIQESTELLSDMESALLELERDAGNQDLINAIFRAAHTIKGTGGVFGFDDVVAFTHVAENVLDKVRSGEVQIDAELIAVLLASRDYIAVLVELAVTDNSPTYEMRQDGEKLRTDLQQYLNRQSGEQNAAQVSKDLVEKETVIKRDSPGVLNDNWHISLRFSQDVLTQGMDPLSFIRYLSRLGELVHVTTITDRLARFSELDPEKCYLGFEIDLAGDTTKEEIESTFEFVREDCELRILPPQASIHKYVEFIREIDMPDLKIGEILVKGKALTEKELSEALAIQSAVRQDGDSVQDQAKLPIGEVLVQEHMVHREVVDAAVEKQQTLRSSVGAKSIRVDAEKLDNLINLIGEMVIAGAGSTLNAYASGDSALIESVSTLNRLVEEVRDSALRLRMVQIGETFNRFQRVVRDVSKELNKEINLVITGAETELDKTVIEKIGDPLMHLVRNAMDHGIEAAELRVKNGKASAGTLQLNAYHDSGSIVIEVSDDGAGLNRERILRKAIDKGLVQEGIHLDDQEIYNLIFEAGFSTAESVTNLSGRGVGMDVVRRNIEALRGQVELDSQPNAGTTFRVRMPLTLAIIDGFQVGVDTSAFVIPLDMVLECVEMHDIHRETSANRNYINLRGEVLPFIRLRELFKVGGRPPRRENVVVVQCGGNKAGLVVDQLLGEFQTVIKPLGRIFSHVKGVSGSTILGNGAVALILDVPGLVQEVSSMESRAVNSAA
jgi:two-component system chemotaxis sensor kinase CheA